MSTWQTMHCFIKRTCTQCKWTEKCFEPHKDKIFPDRCFCFSKCTYYVIFSIFILKVCYPKGTCWEEDSEQDAARTQVNNSSHTFGDCSGCYIHMTSAPRPDCLRSSLGSSVHKLFLHDIFSFVHTHTCLHFYTTGRLMTSKQTKSTPDGHLMCWWYKRLYHSDRPLGLLCVLYPVCTCVSEWPMMSAWVWECVSCTQVYCTIQLPLFANVESYRMNWTVTWSKSYAIICGQLLNFFIELKREHWTSTHI